MLDPIFEYGRSEGETVIGGFVYRGQLHSNLVGKYIFGEFGRQVTDHTPARLFQGNLETGEVLELIPTGTDLFSKLTFNRGESLLSQFVFSIGEDLDGELYILVGDDPVFRGAKNPDGRVLRLEGTPKTPVWLFAMWGLALLMLSIGATVWLQSRRA